MKRKYAVIVAGWMLIVGVLFYVTTVHAGAPDLRGTWDVQVFGIQIEDYTQNGQTPVTFTHEPILVITTQTENVFGWYTEPPDGDGDTVYVTGVIKGNRVTIQERHHATWHLIEGRLIHKGSETKIVGTFYGNEDNGSPPSSAESGFFEAIKRLY